MNRGQGRKLPGNMKGRNSRRLETELGWPTRNCSKLLKRRTEGTMKMVLDKTSPGSHAQVPSCHARCQTYAPAPMHPYIFRGTQRERSFACLQNSYGHAKSSRIIEYDSRYYQKQKQSNLNSGFHLR